MCLDSNLINFLQPFIQQPQYFKYYVTSKKIKLNTIKHVKHALCRLYCCGYIQFTRDKGEAINHVVVSLYWPNDAIKIQDATI